ncbi:hypothetical protein BGZ60DRAFT_570647 [Tricladium varicosporioides]|nr:hypothetical protein BGZ60DRAFT_570647 [Hymenoscyphus varicosporioides]
MTSERRFVPEKAAFSSLPFELRQKIWQSTFQCRTVCIGLRYVDQSITNGTYYGECSFLSHVHAENVTGELYHRTEVQSSDICSHGSQVVAPRIYSRTDPVTLRVCHESREIALSYYQRAFPSYTYENLRTKYPQNINEAQQGYHLNHGREPSTWLNPYLDEIYWHGNMYSIMKLVVLASEEVVKITILSLSFRTDEYILISEDIDNPAFQMLELTRVALSEVLKKFKALKIVRLYHDRPEELEELKHKLLADLGHAKAASNWGTKFWDLELPEIEWVHGVMSCPLDGQREKCACGVRSCFTDL